MDGGHQQFGALLVATGVILAVVGLVIWAGGFGWIGRLPGDIRIERPGFRLYVPLVSMLLISLVLTIVLNLLRRFF
ncbi:MAG: DUF2905 domain-containing protein [Acidobacteriota bacterium]|nr:MAG: DUF2905 domain-containing protein [Acidobacteriota bacterium]